MPPSSGLGFSTTTPVESASRNSRQISRRRTPLRFSTTPRDPLGNQRGPTCPRFDPDAAPDRGDVLGPAPRRLVLVHGRSGMGDRDVLWNHWTWSLGVANCTTGSVRRQPLDEIAQRARGHVWYTAPLACACSCWSRSRSSRSPARDCVRSSALASRSIPKDRLARRVLGRDVFDTWFQTETGSIMISNSPSLRFGRGPWASCARGGRADR